MLSCCEYRVRWQHNIRAVDLNLADMFCPPSHLTDRSKRSMLENLIDGDFSLALPNDPQNNPEKLINILNDVFGKWFYLQIPIYYSKIWFIYLLWPILFIYLSYFSFIYQPVIFLKYKKYFGFKGSSSNGNPKHVLSWNSSMTEENPVGFVKIHFINSPLTGGV